MVGTEWLALYMNCLLLLLKTEVLTFRRLSITHII
jgi:hypothetical protein